MFIPMSHDRYVERPRKACAVLLSSTSYCKLELISDNDHTPSGDVKFVHHHQAKLPMSVLEIVMNGSTHT